MKPQVLIVEDNSLLSSHLAEIVETTLKAEPILASSVSEAMGAVADSLVLAFLDIQIVEGNSYPVARSLVAVHVPIIFVSGNEPQTVPDDLKHVPFMIKPYVTHALVGLAKSMCDKLA
jgi:DNA-binding LytR/AlgR family response regulator